MQDEADVLPLVVRLGGEAIIDSGDVLYRFPELQKRARDEGSSVGGIAGRVASALGLSSNDTQREYTGDFVALAGAPLALALRPCSSLLTRTREVRQPIPAAE